MVCLGKVYLLAGFSEQYADSSVRERACRQLDEKTRVEREWSNRAECRQIAGSCRVWLVRKLIVLWWGRLDVKLCEGSHDGAFGVVTVGDQGLWVGRQGGRMWVDK